MTGLWTLATAIIFFVVSAAYAQAPSDVTGFRGTRWGMSPEEATAALRRQQEADRAAGTPTARWFVIGKTEFSLQPEYDDGKRLRSWTLHPREAFEDEARDRADEIVRLLIERFGQPTFFQLELSVPVEDRHFVWVFPTTTIEFKFRHFEGLGMRRGSASIVRRGSASIVYRPSGKGDAGKL